MTQPDQYVLGYRQAEQERLQQQAQQLAHESSWLFDQIPVTRGARVVEIGCGPHGCLDLLSERVGPTGRVVGVERSAEAVALARTLISQRNLRNVNVLEADARSTGLPRASFDVVTSRLVLVNVPQPEQIVAEAAALVRTGGWVAFHEADYVSHVCDPPSTAWTRLVELLQTYSAMNGIDPLIGRTLPRLLREAGLTDIRVNPIIHVYPPDHGRRNLLLDFSENLSERLVAQKLIGEPELTGLKAELSRHLADPDTLVVSHLYFQSWGRKPGSGDTCETIEGEGRT
jgi:ubiquinone/menaquinone biosynthesis C-methylase UbiE